MTSRRNVRRVAGAIAALSLIAAACGDDDDNAATSAADTASATEAPAATTAAPATEAPVATTAPAATEAPPATTAAEASASAPECDTPEPVKLQLQWFVQSQFAGYYAAKDQGYYDAMCIDLEILEGGVEIVPQTQLANGDADFAIAWVPKALASREAGANITDIAQIFQRSGTLQVSFKDKGITSPEQFAGKTIGNWGFGNEYEIFAALGQAGLDPATDVTLVAQNFDMVGLLDGSIDASEAMTYNEYAQVLEAENPDTGELYTPDDFNVVSYEDVGVGMLQDAIWADAGRLESDAAYKDLAARFVAASIQGWVYCRDNPESCKDIVLAAGPTLGDSHQLWQMNEINKLIWPSPDGIGVINQADWDRTVQIALSTKNAEGKTVLTKTPDGDGYNNQYVQAALTELKGQNVDVTGASFKPITVELKENGA
jgi:NitT/TauT family transport system substrate-binding protein